METPLTEIGSTLIAVAVPTAVAVLFALALVLSVRCGGLRRLYWLACALLLGMGGAGTMMVTCCAPPRILADGSISGEMPPAFGAALLLAVIGCGGAMLGLTVDAFGRWRGTGRAGRT